MRLCSVSHSSSRTVTETSSIALMVLVLSVVHVTLCTSSLHLESFAVSC